MDFFVACDIRHNIYRIEQIVATGIFKSVNAGNPLVKSAFTELMICLRDLVRKCEKYATRISFTDDVAVSSDIPDITALIMFVRDAMCHIHISDHFIVPGKIKASFNIIYRKGTLAPYPGISLTSDYSDDVCLFFGIHRIYLRRHILRAIEETKRQLVPLLPPESAQDIAIY